MRPRSPARGLVVGECGGRFWSGQATCWSRDRQRQLRTDHSAWPREARKPPRLRRQLGLSRGAACKFRTRQPCLSPGASRDVDDSGQAGRRKWHLSRGRTSVGRRGVRITRRITRQPASLIAGSLLYRTFERVVRCASPRVSAPQPCVNLRSPGLRATTQRRTPSRWSRQSGRGQSHGATWARRFSDPRTCAPRSPTETVRAQIDANHALTTARRSSSEPW